MAAKNTKLIKAADRQQTVRVIGGKPAEDTSLPCDGSGDDPASPSIAYASMVEKWDLINTVMAGTFAMRAAGEKYLPSHPNEETTAYNERLSITVLYNVLRLTRDSLVGKIFVEPMEVNFGDNNDGGPFAPLLTDMDGRGTDAHSFCRQWFSDAMDEGFAGVFVDMPKMTEEERKQRTKADDMVDQRKPFGTIVRGSSIIGALYETVGKVQRLVMLRLLENAIVHEGFAEVLKERIRVITPGAFSLYEKRTIKGKDRWYLIETGGYDIPVIPFVLYYTNEDGILCSVPPLLDLAHLNVTHWQSFSDQRVILTVARFPMLAVSGGVGENNGKLNVGPRQVLHTRDPNGRFYYVEHAGKAIEAGEKDINELEKRMASYGAEFLRKRVSNVTATERVLDTTESMSALKDMGIRFKNAIKMMFDVCGLWMDAKFTGKVLINLDFTQDDSNANDLQHLAQMRDNDDISLEDYVRALMRIDVLDENTDVDAFCARVKKDREEADARALKNAADLMAAEYKQKTDLAVKTAAAKPAPAPGAPKPAPAA